MHGVIGSLQHGLARYGYWLVLGAIFLEDFGVPVPGETILITGALEASTGKLNIVVLLLVGWAAAVAGDNVGYAIGRFGGRRLVLRFGRYVGLTPPRLHEAERRFSRFGPFVVVFARFIEILRQLNGILAGIAGMPWPRFLLLNALGAALWAGFWGTLFFELGRRASGFLARYKRFELPALGVLVFLAAAWYLFRWLRRRREHEDDRKR